jgi:hypothetical protein
MAAPRRAAVSAEGGRKAPVWAIDVLQEALKGRVQREMHSIEELEKEKAVRSSAA